MMDLMEEKAEATVFSVVLMLALGGSWARREAERMAEIEAGPTVDWNVCKRSVLVLERV